MRDLFLLDPAVVFLNHGSYGACPRPVFQAWQEWQRRMEAQPVEFLDSRRMLTPRMAEVRAVLAAELGCAASDIVPQVNATEGLNLVAQSLDLAPGDEILTTDHEYAALEKTWDCVARRSGARIVVARVPLPLTSEAAFTASLRAAMTARTKVLFLSHITSATALLFPIAPILAEARARGIFTVIDGAHAPGQIPLDLDTLGADAYAGNCHKWTMAPKGAAFLHVRPEHQARMRPLVISHGWQAEPGALGPFGNTPFVDSIEFQGTRDVSAFLAIPAALEFRRTHDWLAVITRCQEMAAETGARICALTGLEPLASEPFRAPQMFPVPVPDCDPAALQVALREGWGLELPCYRWQDRCIVRFSVQGYTTQGDLDTLVTALSAVFRLS